MEVTIGKTRAKASPEVVKGHFPDKFKTMQCPITNVLDRISDKWSIHTIILLGKSEKLRFSELMKGIHGISQRMLTVTLRSLEEDGLVSRQVFAEIPPRVEYQLTDLGRSLLSQLIHLSEWASENMTKIFESRERYKTEKV
ncbi:winged helix-turn-helix transcriptional regulator [Desertivirga arenae]|uniref:winged helix-turn-helix transcriptional regulator n=1 Tax=Desertivirga arenae TaxID=2810309 RepID=UPI001A970C29|nr:helix-turn-helix domain-containing protein [Pedobacter sp. SYSU D00823]